MRAQMDGSDAVQIVKNLDLPESVLTTMPPGCIGPNMVPIRFAIAI